jgi:hypothetical protein
MDQSFPHLPTNGKRGIFVCISFLPSAWALPPRRGGSGFRWPQTWSCEPQQTFQPGSPGRGATILGEMPIPCTGPGAVVPGPWVVRQEYGERSAQIQLIVRSVFPARRSRSAWECEIVSTMSTLTLADGPNYHAWELHDRSGRLHRLYRQRNLSYWK